MSYAYMVNSDNKPRRNPTTRTFLWSDAERATAPPTLTPMSMDHYVVTWAVRHGEAGFWLFAREVDR